MLPIGTLLGISAALVAGTSWSVLVPLGYAAFGFNHWEALLTSIALDFFVDCVLIGIYTKRRDVHYFFGFIFGMFSFSGIILGLFYAPTFLTKYKYLLKGGLGLIDFGYASWFFIKFFYHVYLTIKNMKARAQDMDRLLEEVQNDEEEMKGKEFMRIPGITLKKRLSGSTMDTWEKETKTLFGYRLPKVMRKFLYTVRCTALAVGCFFLGFVGGLVGMNTGTAICILFNMLLHFRPLKAIGTALFVQAIGAGLLLCAYVSGVMFDRPLKSRFPNVLVALIPTIFGAVIGAIWIKSIKSPRWRYYFVCTCLLVLLGLISTIQPYIIAAHHFNI